MLPILSLILSALVFFAMILGLVLKPAAARRLSAVFMTIAVVGGLIIYGIGYAEALEGSLALTVIRTPMTVIRMFIGVNDLDTIKSTTPVSTQAGLIAFWAVHLMAFYSMASAAMYTIGAGLLRYLRFGLARHGDLTLIYGINEKSVTLGRECVSAGKTSVVFIAESADEAAVNDLNTAGMSVLTGSAAVRSEKPVIRKLRIRKRKLTVYALDQAEDENLFYALRLKDALEKAGVPAKNTQITLPGAEDILAPMLQVSEERYGFGYVNVFDSADLAARALIRTCPPWSFMHFDAEGRATEDFGCAMVSSYDQLNRVSNDGEPQPADTLSLVDLTLVKPVYKRLAEFYSDAADRLPSNPGVFTNMSAARSNAYQFGDNEQIDMANYLETLKKADYKETVAAENDLDEFIEDVKLCVVCRNKDSAEGVNGISIEFPYSDLSAYNDEYEQLKAAKYRKEEKFFNSFCSILASQQKRQNEEVKNDGLLGALLSAIDYTKEEWYVKGFEDYDTADLFIDIPVSRIGDAYLAEFPDKIWDAILDCSTAAYMETEDGLMYLGQEHCDAKDEEGHPLVVASDSWAHIGGRLVCYNSDVALETDEGKLYMGSVHARLNRTQDVTLSIEWDLAKEDSDKPITGKVTGYSINDDESPAFMQKGQEELKSGDVLEFLFDFYDEEGNYI